LSIHTRLSVIIIGKNEENHIKRCIQSVIKATFNLKGTQIIYVDSASTDRTIEIVKKFPITIIGLKPDWDLSPAAGRYIGYLNSRGEYLFFIDGDSLVYHEWLIHGIHFLEKNQDVSAVAGYVHEIFLGPDGSIRGFLHDRYNQGNEPLQTVTLGGIAMYRRSILETVGPFNPYIPVDEERELAMRIRKTGTKLFRIPQSMAITYGPERESLVEIIRRTRTRLYYFGCTLKYCQQQGMGRQYLKERLGFVTTFIVSTIAFLFIVLSAILTGRFILLIFFLFVLMALFVLIKKGDLCTIFTSLLKRNFMSWLTIYSYLKTRIHEVDEYPSDVIVYKSVDNSMEELH